MTKEERTPRGQVKGHKEPGRTDCARDEEAEADGRVELPAGDFRAHVHHHREREAVPWKG